MKIDIDKLTEEELVDLNHRIIQRLKFLESMYSHSEMLKFSIGEKVSFDPPGRGRQVGTLVKYNKKSVTIITESGQRWNVAPDFISKVKSPEASGKGSVVVTFTGKKK